MSNAQPAAGNVTEAQLNEELAGEALQLTALRDAAVTAAGQRGGGTGSELRGFLSRAGLPVTGEITVSLPGGFDAGHYTAAGLAHQLEELRAAHARKIAALRAGAVEAQRMGYVSRADVDAALAGAGLEPLKETTQVTLSGQVTFNYDGAGEFDQGAMQAAVENAVRGQDGVSGVDSSGARASVRKVTA